MIPDAGSFARDGFLGPIRLLTPGQCREVLRHLLSDTCPEPATWAKGGAATDWVLSSLGAHPRLLELLTPILGDNIVLWGSTLIRRTPGQLHPWHVDIESSAPDSRFVTVWIGLENVSSASRMRLIAGSHLCGRTVQQFRAESGCSRVDASTETVLAWARGANPDARLVEPEVSNGDAILFDGRMWHGSHNRGKETRWALILQFAASDCPVRIPDLRVFDWPFALLDTPRPPAVVVQGVEATAENHLVPPPQRPARPRLARLSSSIRKIEMFAEHPNRGWQPYPLLRGSTPALDYMSCHAAVLSPGHSPHPPHAHHDEELLIVLDGEAELLIADRPASDGAQVVPVKAGDFAFYPALQHHTIRNLADSPVTYLMFRWNRPAAALVPNPLRTTVVHAPRAAEADQARGFVTHRVLAAPTRWLRKLHCHTSRLASGAGYAAHIDPYDVAILIQSGRVRTLGREVGPGGLIYYAAGEMHGMRNTGAEPARYIVFEFHGTPLSATKTAPSQATQPRLAPVS